MRFYSCAKDGDGSWPEETTLVGMRSGLMVVESVLVADMYLGDVVVDRDPTSIESMGVLDRRFVEGCIWDEVRLDSCLS